MKSGFKGGEHEYANDENHFVLLLLNTTKDNKYIDEADTFVTMFFKISTSTDKSNAPCSDSL